MITRRYTVPMVATTYTASGGKVYTVTNPHSNLLNSGANYAIVDGTFANGEADYMVETDTATHASIVDGGEIVEVE